MNVPEKSHRVYPQKPEWKIILDYLVTQDNTLVYRLCRKMILHLERMKVPEIYFLIQELNPSLHTQKEEQTLGINWPKPKGNAFIPIDIIKQVFEIADKYIPDDEIAYLINSWIHREKLGNLSKVLEKKHAPLIEVIEALKKYFALGGSKEHTSEEERVGVRVALIYRLFSEGLRYINISKKYITLKAIETIFERIIGPPYGNGKVGGKSAGLILAKEILEAKKKELPILKNVDMPKSWFLTSDAILEFIHFNTLDEFTFTKYQPLENIKVEYPFLEYVFKNSSFPPEFRHTFNAILDDLEGKPIVVRSSSLLEDSFEASFTGKYKSLFISNTGTKEERLAAFTNAIAEVYASTFGPDPIEYRRERNLLDFKEEMGILIMEVVGNKMGKYFLPSFAGVAFSNNEFRWSQRIKRDDGVVRLVAGLGTRAVDRTMNDYPMLFSPGQPDLRINQSYTDIVKYSQQYVDVINLETNSFESVKFAEVLKEAKGNYPAIEKIVSFDKGGMLIDPISALMDFEKEDSAVTFSGLLKNSDFVNVINTVLHELKDVYGGAVDVEFAHDGKTLYLLQCRPQSLFDAESSVRIPVDVLPEHKIFSGTEFINNGKVEGIEFVVYVTTEGYAALRTEDEMKEVGMMVSRLNKMLPKRKFILVGPGRWGSKGDIKLGVPITYSDINNTAMLIEVARTNKDYVPELSFGTHFFQDLVEANIKYLPLYPDKKGNIFNEEFFERSYNSITDFFDGAEKYEDVVRLINVSHFAEDKCLNVHMDGDTGRALAFIADSDFSTNF